MEETFASEAQLLDSQIAEQVANVVDAFSDDDEAVADEVHRTSSTSIVTRGFGM